MNTYHAHGFTRNLYRTADEAAPAAKVARAEVLTDDLAAKLWVITARAELAEMVNPNQLADFLAEIAGLPAETQYRRIAAQIALEDARLLQSGCTCDPTSGIACEACCALADTIEMEY